MSENTEICRGCLTINKDLLSLFISFNFCEEILEIREVFKCCTAIEIFEDDGLPNKICKNCINELDRIYKFRRQCEQSDVYLRNKINETPQIKSECLDDISICENVEFSDEVCNENVEVENVDLKVILCKTCGKCFDNNEDLNEHLTTHTLECSNPIDNVIPCHTKKKRIHKRSINTCEICNKIYPNKWSLQKHQIIHTDEKCYLCNICGKSFKQLASLRSHGFVHTEEKLFKCDLCDKSFKRTSSLGVHRKLHYENKQFTCEMCGRSFDLKQGLNEHIRRLHNQEKRFECNVCLKKFFKKSLLAKHMRMHTGEKPFSCDICNMSFTTKAVLKQHSFIHTGEKPFLCKICEKPFRQSGSVAHHMRLVHKERA